MKQVVHATQEWTKEYVANAITEGEGGEVIISGVGKEGTAEGAEIFNDYEYNEASGLCAHAEGVNTKAQGNASHTEGDGSVATGYASHAEGASSASGEAAHAEGWETNANGDSAHSEGSGTSATQQGSHSEGVESYSGGWASHAEGCSSASGYCAHSEGEGSSATSDCSHAEGYYSNASGSTSHAEGFTTTASGPYSHAEGSGAQSQGECSHAEGAYTVAGGMDSHAEGTGSQSMSSSTHAQGKNTTAGGKGYKVIAVSDANADATGSYTLNTTEGLEVGMRYSAVLSTARYDVGTITAINDNVVTVDNYVRAELNTNTDDVGASNVYNIFLITGRPDLGDTDVGFNSHSEGLGAIAHNTNAHAEGKNTVAIGKNAHAEGDSTLAGHSAHAEGHATKATGACSHSEGYSSTAEGHSAHAEGYYSTASNTSTHAEGHATKATGQSSHSEGDHTIAAGEASHVQGRYNEEDKSNKFAHIVGNGTSSARKNIHTLDWNGAAWFAGEIKVGGTNDTDAAAKVLATADLSNVDNAILRAKLEQIGVDGGASIQGAKIETGSYIGTSDKTVEMSLSFSFTPKIVHIQHDDGSHSGTFLYGNTKGAVDYSEITKGATLTWEGNTVKWLGTYADQCNLNSSGTYRYVAIG